jgi:putative transposase
MHREPIETGEIYHIYNRGVDKRITFQDTDDFRYFIHFLYSLNDSNFSSTNLRRDYLLNSHEEGSTFFMNSRYKRENIVDILAFVLMPNHYHLLLKQRTDNGIPKFMQKLGTGYTMMFNEKYERTGSLFQGRYKSVRIANEKQLMYIPHYIHLNPLGNTKKRNLVEHTHELMKYKWSSFPDYCGIKNFPSVTSRELILSIFGGSRKYIQSLNTILCNNDLLSYIDEKECIDFRENEKEENTRTSMKKVEPSS